MGFQPVYRRWVRLRDLFRFQISWKTSALANTITTGIMCLVLVILLSISASKAGGITTSFMFFSGACDGTISSYNVSLHLLINIFSTAILASSNFFMQILSAPSRKEIDQAHRKGSWLDIGIASFSNVFHISKSKRVLWLAFLTSSIPIHLIFNSAVFQTDMRDSDFLLTIAAEDFVSGNGSWYGPGASLVDGLTTNRNDYLNPGSNAAVAMNSIMESSSITNDVWRNLSVQECREQYLNGSGIQKHRHVVVVVNGSIGGWADDATQGWTRDQIHLLSQADSEMWDPIVPAGALNTLWYASPCSMLANNEAATPYCNNSCSTMLGGVIAGSTWLIDFRNTANMSRLGTANGILPVVGCRAEPVDIQCRLGVSNTLLLAVTICTLFKFALCLLVVLQMDHRDTIVLFGDAVASFIRDPDASTAHMCLIGSKDVTNATKTYAIVRGARQWRPKSQRRGSAVPFQVREVSYYLCGGMILGLMGAFIGGLSSGAQVSGTLDKDGSGGTFHLNFTEAFIGSVLIANMPQLYLSLCYFAYNSFYTRMELAREWAAMSTKSKPLRVTDPKGEQSSSYWLQLRLKYSIPLILVSIGLHWMASNSLYIMIGEGAYFSSSSYIAARGDPTLPDGTAITLGYSLASILSLSLIFTALILLPMVTVDRLRIPGSMSFVRSNSFAIAAACHVGPRGFPSSAVDHNVLTIPEANGESSGASNTPATTIYNVPSPEGLDCHRSIEMQSLISHSDTLIPTRICVEDEQEALARRKISESKLKWGEIEMPPAWHEAYNYLDHYVGHLGFGSEDQTVEPPVDGNWYA